MMQLFEIVCLCGREIALGLESEAYWGKCPCGRIWKLEEVSGGEPGQGSARRMDTPGRTPINRDVWRSKRRGKLGQALTQP